MKPISLHYQVKQIFLKTSRVLLQTSHAFLKLIGFSAAHAVIHDVVSGPT